MEREVLNVMEKSRRDDDFFYSLRLPHFFETALS
jgi:hypothetical protein